MKTPSDNQTSENPIEAPSERGDGLGGSTVRPFRIRPAEEIILTKGDVNLCLGSQELLKCPFCGGSAMSHGEKTENGKAICWKITCLRFLGFQPSCTASVWATDPDQETARNDAVQRWNRRPNDKVSYPERKPRSTEATDSITTLNPDNAAGRG